MIRIAIACLMLVMFSCASPKAPQTAAKEFQMRGEVTGLDAGGHVATIKHEAIPGFMGAMTMGYPVKDPGEFSKLAVGEPITGDGLSKWRRLLDREHSESGEIVAVS